MNRAWLIALAAWAGTARADIWKHASNADPDRAAYDEALEQGDDDARAASASQNSRSTTEHLLDNAVALYNRAAALEPGEGEPLFRIGTLLYSFYFDCVADPRYQSGPLCGGFKAPRARQTIAAWDEFEARAPLDPRLSVQLGGRGDPILLRRAILHTKLATRADLEAAAHDYEKILDRSEQELAAGSVLGNLAETYMMLDRLDDSLAMYRRALRVTTEVETAYGMAIALDRSDMGPEAIDLILAQATPPEKFEERIQSGDVFYVPAGEEYYYRALIDEAYDNVESAIAFWKAYIQSGAHPEFQPRARQHLEALVAKQKVHPQHRHSRIDELPF